VNRIHGAVALAGLLIFPFVAPFSVLGDAVQAGILVIVTVSLVVLTGWVGQISLAQASFVGLAAFTTGLVSRGWHVPFPISLLFAGAVSAAAAALVGVIALRVRGLYLAVATLIFGWMVDEYLFRSSWLVGVGGSSSITVKPIGRRGGIPFFDFSDRRVLYFLTLGCAVAALAAAANARDSRTGRAFFAVRGSEIAAASLGIDVVRYKLLAFAFSGLLAGVAGNLVIVAQHSAVPAQFSFTVSLYYLAVAVVGGLSSLPGAVAASVLFAALSEVFYRVAALTGWLEVVGAGLLAVVLLGYPGGLAALGRATATFVRNARRAGRSREVDARVDDQTPITVPPRALSARPSPPLPAERRVAPPVMAAEDIVVRFGGLTAVDGMSVAVHEGEIVGLIGPNGAGKTTMFNAISGLNEPCAGRVTLFGADVTGAAVHERARLGVGRTFQAIQLFSQLTVFENLLVATHLQNPTGMAAHIFITAGHLEAERSARVRVDEIIDLLGLGDVAHRAVSGLPFGLLRNVEVARALVTSAPFLMLDEPASGLDNSETDRLAELLFFIRSELDRSILLIEHDVRLVTSVSDYIYVIDRGQPLAHGTPAEIQQDPAVVAAYLGEQPVHQEVGVA